MLRIHKNRSAKVSQASAARQVLCVACTIAMWTISTAAILGGCEEYTVAPTPPPPPPPIDPLDPDGDGFHAKSVLGKAKETAENQIDKMNEYQQKVGDFADDVFKKGP